MEVTSSENMQVKGKWTVSARVSCCITRRRNFSLKDNGQGIPINYRENVFEPVQRLHGADTPERALGLALRRTIVARNGGRIWVESEGSGCGAVFCFTLPAAQSTMSIAESVGT